jgi:gamma-glutamyl AIG2-like cyclotransferase
MTDASNTGFFYGTLMAPSVLRRVIFGQSLPDSTTKRPLPSPRPALLKDFQRHRVKNCDYPAIVSKTDATVRGTLVTGLTEGDWWRLDVFEGDDYTREVVKVLIRKDFKRNDIQTDGEWNTLDEKELEDEGEEILAQTYVWKSGVNYLEPREWDFEEFVREKMWRWAGDTAENEGEYDELDDAVRDADPTGGRHVNGGIITDALKDSKVSEEQLQSAV